MDFNCVTQFKYTIGFSYNLHPHAEATETDDLGIAQRGSHYIITQLRH